ncbi:cobalt ECF transporter T component CbiQ [Paenibacillus sp. YYML68]|uniref:cobalt ECF transporter T component CbiQ n=1 Tax=Paenibacillus sp. YYML68 TaxID=2909250 RepID=UPI00248FFF44|nr:cobalt ECF transporter T component CbiQ [Paenibacillus sp. YYML68]
MIQWIDRVSHSNKLVSLDPLWKSGFAASLLLLAYVTEPLVQLLIALWLLLWLIVYANVPLRLYSALLGATLLFYAASLPALLLELAPPESGGYLLQDAVWSLQTERFGTLYAPGSRLSLALSILARVLACASCMYFLALTTPMLELLQVLYKLRMPMLVLELMQIMYRFLFILSQSREQLYAAQLARGGHSSVTSRIRDSAWIAVSLFSKTMQRYSGLSNGLQARGFGDGPILAPYVPLKVARRYWIEAGAGMTVLILLELSI